MLKKNEFSDKSGGMTVHWRNTTYLLQRTERNKNDTKFLLKKLRISQQQRQKGRVVEFISYGVGAKSCDIFYLGESTKRTQTGAIGAYGEGLKMAVVLLKREKMGGEDKEEADAEAERSEQGDEDLSEDELGTSVSVDMLTVCGNFDSTAEFSMDLYTLEAEYLQELEVVNAER